MAVRAFRGWLACMCASLSASCAGLPSLDGRTATSALADTSDTRLGRAIAPQVAAHPGLSAIYPMPSPLDAFAARGLLAEAAERSIDAQYYIWHDDTSGDLLFDALLRAAERGVRVRLLLDDLNTGGLDGALALLEAQPNCEVRLFNPFPNRSARWLDFASDFSRVNRRMHNKSFTVDNQATIVGGRNVADEYFGNAQGVAFADLDVLAFGPTVQAVSSEFDAYWNSACAYAAADLLGRRPAAEASAVRARWSALRSEPDAARYLEALRTSPLVEHLLANDLPVEWAAARVLADDASKVLQPTTRTDLHLLPQLREVAGDPQREFDLISPYFVPTEPGVASLRAMRERGVAVRVLTNSLAATDVGAVHAGYAKSRRALLRCGVELFELKPKPHGKDADRARGVGSSDVSLHAKTFVVDRERVFVGSFNFDPRSARLNTEMGVVIESPALAARVADELDGEIRNDAYQVRLDSDGDLEWIERTPDGEHSHHSEPETSWWRRAGVTMLGWLPIDWLL